MSKKTIEYSIENNQLIEVLYGNLEKNLKKLEDEFDVKMSIKENSLLITGEETILEVLNLVLFEIENTINTEKELTNQRLDYIIEMSKKGKLYNMDKILDKTICMNAKGKAIKPKTLGQKMYIEKIYNNDIVFGIGPAGTGKTYLAMATAVKAFRNNEVDRIILTRPAVEAGENLGFLPGDLQEKIDPYLRPLYDALFDIFGYENYLKLVDRGLIEVAPLAYMRGRTLENAYIILDEAQNTTNEQMKMFLTRLGYGSKAIITGDITQVDLPRGKSSGLAQASKILKNVKGLDFMYFTSSDIVRHPLVQRIIDAYEDYDEKKESK
ncbi:MAG: PhoH family protein [Tissierellia bacterium]|nr:PhoH family protein [Tissierellia bacterium]